MSQTTTIQTPAGTIIGLTTHANALIQARGIPYATAARFSPPEVITSYKDTPQTCTSPAPICPQLPSRLSSVLGPLTTGHALSESCLHLSITAPADTSGAQKPVLVWLHGGAYISGGGDLPCYQPLDLAKRGLVCVTITYRLGVFGYLPLPGIAPANLGLLDQRAALQWIQRNISAFGGDPRNVTMAGQSAGADSIICLLVAEGGASGLFHRAILLSPPLREIKERADTPGLLSRHAESLLTKDPRAMAVDELLAVQKELLMHPVRGQIMLFAPALGEYPLPDKGEFDERLAEAVKDVPILIGWTEQDGRPFSGMIPHPLLALFRVPVVGRWLEALRTWYITRSYFSAPSKWFHDLVVRAGGASTTYSFGWSARGNALGACHCVDIPFVLGSWEAWKEAPMLHGEGVKDEVRALGEELKHLWVGFTNGRALRDKHLSITRGFTLDGVYIK